MTKFNDLVHVLLCVITLLVSEALRLLALIAFSIKNTFLHFFKNKTWETIKKIKNEDVLYDFDIHSPNTWHTRLIKHQYWLFSVYGQDKTRCLWLKLLPIKVFYTVMTNLGMFTKKKPAHGLLNNKEEAKKKRIFQNTAVKRTPRPKSVLKYAKAYWLASLHQRAKHY